MAYTQTNPAHKLTSQRAWLNLGVPLATMACLAFLLDISDGTFEVLRLLAFYFAVSVGLTAAWVVTRRLNTRGPVHSVLTLIATGIGATLGCAIVIVIAFSS